MTGWTAAQLDAIDRADELAVTTGGADGTRPPPVTIWVVRVDDEVYVRWYRGEAGAWYRPARHDGEGRVQVAGRDQAVRFEPVTDGRLSDAIDAAYTAKYARYGDSYVKPMVAAAARSATLRLLPHEQHIRV